MMNLMNRGKRPKKRVIDFCAHELDLTPSSTDIERAHRLGSYLSGKNRPIFIKLLRSKDKESILSVEYKMKATECAT